VQGGFIEVGIRGKKVGIRDNLLFQAGMGGGSEGLGEDKERIEKQAVRY